MIYVNGVLLPADEERIARGLAGGQRIPDPADCDGCTICPDFYPMNLPAKFRIPLRPACVVHDYEKAYEEGGTPWDRTLADLRLLSNWIILLTMFEERIKSWGFCIRWGSVPVMMFRFCLLRAFGGVRR